jgi:Flp pilus assembly protein TadG
MKRPLRVLLAHLRRDERGASALEFSILAIPLLAFMFGILEFGRAMWTEEALQSTASTVARCVGLQIQQRAAISAAPNYETSVCPYASNPPTGVASLYPQGSLALCGCNNSSGYNSTNTTAYANSLASSWGVTLESSANGGVKVTTATSCPGMSGSTSYISVTLSNAFPALVKSLIPALASQTLTGTACYPVDP